MAEFTTNYSLRKPDPNTDYIDVVTDVNDNMDTIDTEMARLATIYDAAPVVTKAVWSADESKVNSTTLSDSTTGTLAVAANTTYMMRALLIAGEIGTVGMKLGFTYPASCTLNWGIIGPYAMSVSTYVATEANMFAQKDTASPSGTVTLADLGSYANPTAIFIQGLIQVGATAGNLVLQFAQNSLSPSDAITVLPGSFILLQKAN